MNAKKHILIYFGAKEHRILFCVEFLYCVIHKTVTRNFRIIIVVILWFCHRNIMNVFNYQIDVSFVKGCFQSIVKLLTLSNQKLLDLSQKSGLWNIIYFWLLKYWKERETYLLLLRLNIFIGAVKVCWLIWTMSSVSTIICETFHQKYKYPPWKKALRYNHVACIAGLWMSCASV